MPLNLSSLKGESDDDPVEAARASGHIIQVYRRDDGLVGVRCDGGGLAAVSAPVLDPLAHIRDIAFNADLELDDSVDGQLTISIPPGA